ncbi:hypothetical protein [Rheinheimera sp. 4Y26]|uniref:hypothetical protein n=1 Tax=Rheinheimera sp. 4Y26 TaxID=2977811 RepID=UPI0021B13CF4|nr:hypothetical protein [Rheinheimera sp. 4Y26]MCT6700895.1 hypothetical protein [Rheinheimera sp. 4Y26]
MNKANEIKLALRDATNAVNRLDKCGYQVIGISLNQSTPVITINTPPKHRILNGAEVLCVKERGNAPERIQSARFEGCLVTWKADPLSIQ